MRVFTDLMLYVDEEMSLLLIVGFATALILSTAVLVMSLRTSR